MAITTTSNERLESLLETLGEFFPHGQIKPVPRLSARQAGWRLVPSARNPRLAVPADVPKAAMSSAIRPCASDGPVNKARRYALAAVLRTWAAVPLMPAGITAKAHPGSITEHLEQVFGQPVCFGLMTGSARANRKPVLGIFDQVGTELGFAKVGLSDLAADLVDNEHRALQAMNSSTRTGIQVPRVISHERWNSKPVLVMSALRPDAVQRALPLPLEAVRAIISSAPVRCVTVANSAWYATIEHQLESLEEVNEAGELLELVRRVANYATDSRVAFGAWHGDFGAWNMARTSTAPMVWDWERYEQQMPLGLDLFHFSAHVNLRAIGEMPAAIAAMRQAPVHAAVVTLHREQGIDVVDRETGNLVALLYLATLATRFLQDGHRHHVPATFQLGCWHLAVMQELMNNSTWG